MKRAVADAANSYQGFSRLNIKRGDNHNTTTNTHNSITQTSSFNRLSCRVAVHGLNSVSRYPVRRLCLGIQQVSTTKQQTPTQPWDTGCSKTQLLASMASHDWVSNRHHCRPFTPVLISLVDQVNNNAIPIESIFIFSFFYFAFFF